MTLKPSTLTKHPVETQTQRCIIALSVTPEQLGVAVEKKICHRLLAIDNVKEVCYDEWYGPYIYCVVHEDDEKTIVRALDVLDQFFEQEGCTQQPIA
jgi:hypothetical protein